MCFSAEADFVSGAAIGLTETTSNAADNASPETLSSTGACLRAVG